MDNKKSKSTIKTPIGYQMYREPKSKDTTTDVFYKVEKRMHDTNVAIPTIDAIIEAKEWVDDINKM